MGAKKQARGRAPGLEVMVFAAVEFWEATLVVCQDGRNGQR